MSLCKRSARLKCPIAVGALFLFILACLWASTGANADKGCTMIAAVQNSDANHWLCSNAMDANPRLGASEYQKVGMTWRDLGDIERSLAAYSRAIELDSSQAEYFVGRGLAWQNLDKHKRAIADFDAAIELNRASASAYNNRGISWLRLGDNKKALLDFEMTLTLEPRNSRALNNKGVVLLREGNAASALEFFDAAIEADSTYGHLE